VLCSCQSQPAGWKRLLQRSGQAGPVQPGQLALITLGEAAGCEIVTRPHTQLAALARRTGGAAKPSGAGGGDLGVAFTIGNDATQKLREDIRASGLTLLSLGAPAPGLRLENA